MYAGDYGDPALARREAATLAAQGLRLDACRACADRACAGACPFGLALDGLLLVSAVFILVDVARR